MELQKASKKKAKIKMALQGPSGSGKTMSSLLIAYGLCGSWSRVVVIDSEHHSSDLYADLGSYNVLPITARTLQRSIFLQLINALQQEWMLSS